MSAEVDRAASGGGVHPAGPPLASRLFALLDRPHFVAGCFLVFLLLRVAIVAFVPVEPHTDDAWYFARAIAIASGQGYTQDGLPTAYWPVGYPGMLGVLFKLFGASLLTGQIANLIFAAGTFFLVLALARHVLRNERAARLSVLLLAVYPNNIGYTPILGTEIYFTFLILLGAWLYLTRTGSKWLVLAGLVFGLAALTKPQVIFLPGFLVLLRLWRDRADGAGRPFVRAVATGAVLYATVAAVLIPWAVRNTLAFGEVVLISTNGGSTLLGGNNPSATGGHVEDDPLIAERRFTVADQVAADRRARALAVQWIEQHPGRFLVLMPLKAFHLWAWDGESEWFYQFDFGNNTQARLTLHAVRVINQIFYVSIMLAFLAALVPRWRRRAETAWPWPLFPYIFVAYLTLISMVFSGQSRFHFPAMPWIIMIAAWLAVDWLERRRAAGEG